MLKQAYEQKHIAYLHICPIHSKIMSLIVQLYNKLADRLEYLQYDGSNNSSTEKAFCIFTDWKKNPKL